MQDASVVRDWNERLADSKMDHRTYCQTGTKGQMLILALTGPSFQAFFAT